MAVALSVIVPCYNEAALLESAYREIRQAARDAVGEDHEIIFVDDGSDDGSHAVLERLAASDPAVRVIAFSRNFGKEAALSAGIARCRGDLALLLDADLQDPPSLLSPMLAALRDNGADVVYGVRRGGARLGALRSLTAAVFYRVLGLLADLRIPADTADFRLVNRNVIDAFKRFGERDKYVRGLITWTGFKQVPFAYERRGRAAGRSRFTTRRLLRLASTGIFYFSTRPLKIIIGLGLACIVVGLLLLAWVLFSVFSPGIHPASGWASMVTAIVFFSGVQLLTLGVIGGYVGRIFEEVKARPEYLVRRTINFDAAPSPTGGSSPPPRSRRNPPAGARHTRGSARPGRRGRASRSTT
jgi:dolichol-phosphate mannosyltransferase